MHKENEDPKYGGKKVIRTFDDDDGEMIAKGNGVRISYVQPSRAKGDKWQIASSA